MILYDTGAHVRKRLLASVTSLVEISIFHLDVISGHFYIPNASPLEMVTPQMNLSDLQNDQNTARI
jgi:hypothetical protein